MSAAQHHAALIGTVGLRASPEALAKARLMLLDTVGCIVAARAAPEIAALESTLAAADPGPFRFPGGPAMSLLGGTAAAAMAATWDEACEGLALAHGRPGVPVIAALLPQALHRNATVDAFAECLVAGYEAGARAGAWLRIRPGMHVDANWPSIGVAAALARLMRLPAAQQLAAMNTAACQLGTSLYLPVTAGATARNTYLAHSAWLGAMAAAAAASGISAPENAMPDYAARFAAPADPVPEAGRFLILDAYLKPHAAVRHVHYAAEAARRIRDQLAGETGSIRALRLWTYAEALTYCGNRDPQQPIQAQFSLSFGVAAALRHGGIDASVYREGPFREAELRRLESLVQITADETQKERGARLEADTAAGTLEARVDAVKGDPSLPMGREDVLEKFARYGGAGPFAIALLDCRGDTPFEEVWRLLR